MKWSISNTILRAILFIVLCCSISQSAHSQNRGEKIKQKRETMWARLIPTGSTLQFAGSMGMLSLGPSWTYGKKKNWETEFLIGYLPRFYGKKGYVTMTLKENYIPWDIPLFPKQNSKWVINPLTASLYINKIFGESFWSHLPDRYPTKYYEVATNLRVNLALGSQLTFNLSKNHIEKSIAFFYEVSSNDLYILASIQDKSIRLKDIVSLSVGIRCDFW